MNFSNVYTKKHLTVEGVTNILEQVSQKYAFGLLGVDYRENQWILSVGGLEGFKSCWLESRRHFVMAATYRGEFLDWLCNLIQDELVLAFDGWIKHDCIPDKKLTSWNTPKSYKEYLTFSYGEGLIMFIKWHFWPGCPRAYKKGLKSE